MKSLIITRYLRLPSPFSHRSCVVRASIKMINLWELLLLLSFSALNVCQFHLLIALPFGSHNNFFPCLLAVSFYFFYIFWVNGKRKSIVNFYPKSLRFPSFSFSSCLQHESIFEMNENCTKKREVIDNKFSWSGKKNQLNFSVVNLFF